MPAEKRAARRQRVDPYAKTHGCPHYPATFERSCHLRRHVRTVHEKRRDYQCPHCSKAFGQAGDRARHMRSKHPNDDAQAAECSVCLELLAGVADKASTPCAHVFCRACIVAVLALHGACPLCRQPCTAAQLQ